MDPDFSGSDPDFWLRRIQTQKKGRIREKKPGSEKQIFSKGFAHFFVDDILHAAATRVLLKHQEVLTMGQFLTILDPVLLSPGIYAMSLSSCSLSSLYSCSCPSALYPSTLCLPAPCPPTPCPLVILSSLLLSSCYWSPFSLSSFSPPSSSLFSCYQSSSFLLSLSFCSPVSCFSVFLQR